MSLRNQPYIPLYVQDYLTDEKLNMCSWQTQGIYIKILCILHKQENYGCILFKQNDKQKQSSIDFFASVLIRNLPCQYNDMIVAIGELISNGVLIIDEEKLYQKRMVKDGQISEERSKAAKKGGGNPNLFKQTNKQIDKQITENENENNSIDIVYSIFYDKEILLSNNDENYINFIKVIFGENILRKKLDRVLKMPEQVTFEQFKTIYNYKEKYKVSIGDYLVRMENWKDLNKKNNSVQLTILDWIRRDKK